MKIFIFSAFILGLVAMSNSNIRTNYSANDGVHSPGTLSSKSTMPMNRDTRGADMTGSEVSEPAVPTTQVNPANINTSPNPAPGKGVDDSSYGETITNEQPSIHKRQAEEESPDQNSQPKR